MPVARGKVRRPTWSRMSAYIDSADKWEQIDEEYVQDPASGMSILVLIHTCFGCI